MKIVIDMNIPPTWVSIFEAAGYEAVHWSSVGDITATDETIMKWAVSNGYMVFTHCIPPRYFETYTLTGKADEGNRTPSFSLEG